MNEVASTPGIVPDYDLRRRIGVGAYGEVWLACSRATGVWRAVKLVHRATFESDRPFEREFDGIRKFEAVSRAHPSQLALFHVGRDDAAGCFYYVMELADDAAKPRGSEQCSVISDQFPTPSPESLLNTDPLLTDYSPKTLRSDLKGGRLPAARVIEIGLALTEALAHLHGRGLVHRDVKPSNIIFVGGRPKLADIGLVADASDTCSIVGTEGYLPPEGPGTPQADLFALGKVLYEATTGLDRRELPKLPEDLRTWPDASEVFELNEIILKACSYDAKDRYQSAEEMHADLVLLEVGRSVRQKRQADRHWQVLRRSSVWLVLAVVAFALFAIRNRLGPPPTNPEFRKRSTNSFANRQYNIGRSLYQKNTTASTAKAAEYFQAAVNADANFALAQAALAAAWSWGDVGTNRTWALLPRAKENAERALAKDDSLSEAYLALAMHAWILEWDWPKTEKFFKRAINCDPQNPQPHEWYGQFLRAMGQTNEAVRELETAVTINPRSRTGIAFLGRALLSARRYSEAVERMELLDEMQSDSMSLWCLGEALSWGGQIERSITVLARAAELNGSDPVITTVRTEALTKALHEGGEAAFWQKRLEFLRTETSDPMDLAAACASAGQTDEALDLLERAYREHHVFLVWDLKAHPEWDSLRGHPRFKALLKKLRLD